MRGKAVRYFAIKHEAKGEQRVCGFLVGTDRFTAGRTAADASASYKVT